MKPKRRESKVKTPQGNTYSSQNQNVDRGNIDFSQMSQQFIGLEKQSVGGSVFPFGAFPDDERGGQAFGANENGQEPVRPFEVPESLINGNQS